MLLQFRDAKHLRIVNTWFRRADKKNITYGSGCNESETVFCAMGKVDCKLLKNVKVTTGELLLNQVQVFFRQVTKKEGRLDART